MLKMPQKTLDGNDTEEDDFWSENTFMETISPEISGSKNRTFHMKHDEEMNFKCAKCNAQISAHNRDWHKGMCDACFDKMFFPDS